MTADRIMLHSEKDAGTSVKQDPTIAMQCIDPLSLLRQQDDGEKDVVCQKMAAAVHSAKTAAIN